MLRKLLALMVLALPIAAAGAGLLSVVGFNVGSDSATGLSEVAEQTRRLDGVDIWDLSEVKNETSTVAIWRGSRFSESGHFRYFVSRSGGGRLSSDHLRPRQAGPSRDPGSSLHAA